MPRSYFHEQLAKRLQEAINTQAEALGNGAAQDIQSYRETVGYIRGLGEAIKVADDVAEGMQ